MKRSLSIFSILLATLVLSCNKNIESKPNIVFVLVDQMRAQSTAYNEDPNLAGKTPNLDRLARSGVNFKNAVSVCPVCTPYRASLLTGQYPTSTGMFFNDIQLPEESLTMAEIFKEAGYSTAYIGKWHLDGMGRDAFTPPERRQGFDYWKALECSHDYNKLMYYSGNDTTKHYWEGYGPYAETDDAIKYIQDHAQNKDPFLLFLAFGTPHFPHNTAPEDLKELFNEEEIILRKNVPPAMQARARKESVGYYAHIMAIDSCLGNIQKTLDKSGLSENTIFVFTSDHGEMMGSQGVRPKLKQLAYAESVKVPFLISYPALTGDKKIVVNSPINTPDILPTLLELADIPAPETIEGESMLEAILDPGRDKGKAALIMNISPFDVKENPEYRGIYTDTYAYIENLDGPWMMFNNKKDPYQMNNLVNRPDFQSIEEELTDILWNQLRKIKDDFKPRDFYIDKWAYELNKYGYIPYHGVIKPQGPSLNKKNTH